MDDRRLDSFSEVRAWRRLDETKMKAINFGFISVSARNKMPSSASGRLAWGVFSYFAIIAGAPPISLYLTAEKKPECIAAPLKRAGFAGCLRPRAEKVANCPHSSIRCVSEGKGSSRVDKSAVGPNYRPQPAGFGQNKDKRPLRFGA